VGKLLNSEKKRYNKFKNQSNYFSNPAKKDGLYRKIPRKFCISENHSKENLFFPIQETAIQYFKDFEIKWHDGIKGQPSNHLCDSMVCGVNHLFPFANQPLALVGLLKPFFPDLNHMLPIENNQFVAFEWIGAENYLGERISNNGKRTRGANFTSADAAVMFEKDDGKKQIVLIEWKYTESYSPTSLEFSKAGTDRKSIYNHLFERDDFPLDKNLLPSYASLFFEPFYQFTRQQCLANEMEKAGELGADAVSLLHISPDANKDFQKITSSDLEILGSAVTEVWKKLVTTKNRFLSTSVENMFWDFPTNMYPEMEEWKMYIMDRYRW
jgi:hypothetical protein